MSKKNTVQLKVDDKPKTNKTGTNKSFEPSPDDDDNASDASSDSGQYVDYDRPVFVVVDWKMNGSRAEVASFAKKVNYAAVYFKPYVEVVVMPPLLYLNTMRHHLKDRINVGSQNVFGEPDGPYTGGTSTTMLEDLRIATAMIGHWERRRRWAEDNNVISDKIRQVTTSKNLVALCCFGEDAQSRRDGTSLKVLFNQLKVIAGAVANWDKAILVYEPVWSYEGAEDVHQEVEFPDLPPDFEETPEDGEDGNNQEQTSTTTPKEYDMQEFSTTSGKPQAQELDELLGLVRDWLRENVSKRAQKMTPILVRGAFELDECVEMLQTANIDGFVYERSNPEQDEVVIKIVNKCAIVADEKPNFE